MLPKGSQHGFTLVELLVAITIVAILSGVGFTVFAQSQIVARDSRRKHDFKTLQTALEIYYEKHGYYPSYETAPGISGQGNSYCIETTGCTFPTDWPNLFQWGLDPAGTVKTKNPAEVTTDYIGQVPIDPINNRTYHYNYYGEPKGGKPDQDYILCATLENTADPQFNAPVIDARCQSHHYQVFSPNH